MIDKNRQKKIVAASWHPGGANAIAPVIKRLIEEGKTDVVVIGHQFSEEIFRSKGISYKTIASYGLKDVSLDSMTQLLEMESPDLVLTGTSAQDEGNRDVIEQTLTLAARKKSIKSLSVLDFWGNYSLRFNNIYTGERFKFLPDRIAIMDEVAQQAMLDEGFNKTRLILTGNPHFDDLSVKVRNFRDSEKEAIRDKVALYADLLLFFAGNAFRQEKESWGYWDLDVIRLINTVLKHLPERKAGLAVKLHPRMPMPDFENIKKYIEEYGEGRIKLVRDVDSQQLVLASDLTLIAFSTIGIEAVYMEKPCLSLQPGLKRKDVLIVSEKGFIPVGYTTDDCIRELRKAVLDNKYREKELPKRAAGFRTDGKATEKVVELVYEMLRDKRCHGNQNL